MGCAIHSGCSTVLASAKPHQKVVFVAKISLIQLVNRFVSFSPVLLFALTCSAQQAPNPAGPDPRIDPGKTSRNIHLSGALNPTPAHPYAGFWKADCRADIGLAIAAAEPGVYSVSLCGPGACYKPGTYSPNTKLVGDDSYKIESSTRMLVKRADGSLMPHERCQSAP